MEGSAALIPPFAFRKPTRSSFARGCLRSVVSKMGLEIEVEYYERQGSFLHKVTEVLVNAKDAPLLVVLSGALPEKFQEMDEDPEIIIRCFAGNIEGQELSLDQKPNEIDYIIDAVKNEDRPVLLLCKDYLSEDRCGTPDSDSLLLDRSASMMVRELIGTPGTNSGILTPPLLESPPTPPTPGSAASECAFHPDKNGTALKANSAFRKRRAMGKAHTLTHVPNELYDCQEDLILFEDGMTSSDEATSLVDESSPIRSKYTERLSRSPDFILSQTSDPGPGSSSLPTNRFFTLQRPKKKGSIFSLKRLTVMNPKLKSFDITPPSPNPRVNWESDDRKWKRKTAIRRKRKISGLGGTATIPETSYTFQIKSVHVVTTAGKKMEIPCQEHNTIGELKEAVAQQLNKHDTKRPTRWKSSDFTLSYKAEGREYELFNDWQFIYTTSLYNTWARMQSDTPITLRPSNETMEHDLQVVHRISQLAGVMMDTRVANIPGAEVDGLRRIAAADYREVQWARRTLHSFVDHVARSRDPEEYALSMELASSVTSAILALKIPIDNKVEITFHYKQCFSLVRRISVQQYANGILADIFPCMLACGLVENKISAYTLQISGEKSYLSGKHEIIHFKDIRRCIIKGEAIHLSVIEKPSVEGDKPLQLNWLPIDPCTGQPPLHTDITRTSQRDCEVEALSVWDREEDFSVRIVCGDNLPVVQGKSLSQRPQAVVEATLYHGDNPLCPSVVTAAHPLEHSIKWKETLNFKIAKKNIPKAAKIMFVIHEPVQRRESFGPRKPQRFLYWGLTSVFDHQNMMYNGERVMNLWRGDKKEKGKNGEESFKPNPCGPASNNPDTKAVTLLIKFDAYGYPVYYPHSAPQSWSALLEQEANIAVRKQFQRLLEFIQEGKLHSALPAYIEKVHWGSLSESLEVYSLLDQIADARQTFPVETALKLLDCDFPDENVRGFATRVLEEMPDEQLEDFLLQLTQALKFELNHDSLLARLLLKRALNNKRIGHFFFWYLKCEMYNPQYTTRFGVILEAYLKGCGETMLKQFEDQVEMQTRLEEIGRDLKQWCNDDHSKMQTMLPEMLETRGVPSFTLTPVYNPRIQLGNLRPTKCKIMASKKKPQWLEMYNVDPTALRHTPIRLILKLGDDLRQDMITLRMFSLFEKLWEEEGLDLALIPYGCMATGPSTGFIEVVKHARTIAEVSGVSNSTKLYDWIKSHQKNEFGEIEPENVKAAVKRFIHSCAGYSVATYVLGIGDRHNDNIMVTTSGNLFHIDFGHFLGNIKYCMGFKREWAPFVLTPDFVYVMGGEGSSTFETYKNLCCRAFLTLRRHADLIINLFSIMRSTGIPELTCVDDTDYIKNALVLEKSEHEAEQVFRKVIKKCLDLKWTVQIMWKFHLLKKKGSS